MDKSKPAARWLHNNPYKGAVIFFGVGLLLLAMGQVGEESGTAMGWAGLLAMYFTPAFLAHLREHPQQRSISLVNLVPVIGFVISLVWAVNNFESRGA